MNKIFTISITLFVLSTYGCRPYEPQKFEFVNTSETAFLVPLDPTNGTTIAFTTEAEIEKYKVSAQKVRINQVWIQTGYIYLSGEYQDACKVIKVDRQPITVHFDKTGNNAIWVESKDSIGFSTGIAMTARIKDDTSAVKFLHNYPSGSLKNVMEHEVRARVQKVFAEQAASEEINILREHKVEIINAIEEDIVPFFEKRGIEITSVGSFGGFEYENPKTQEAIDKVYQAQQDKDVAIAEAQAAEERKNALKLLGEGEAAKALEVAKGEAEAIKLKADAKEYEVQKATTEQYMQLRELELRLEHVRKWDGRYPQYMMGDSKNLMMTMPMPTSSK